MNVDKDTAFKIWETMYGSSLWAIDCFGSLMYKFDYGDIDKVRVYNGSRTLTSNFGWEIDHIMPKSHFINDFKATFYNNLEPMHWRNNRNKADQTSFIVNGNSYRVVKCYICESANRMGYGIMDSNSGRRVDWKGTHNKYFVI